MRTPIRSHEPILPIKLHHEQRGVPFTSNAVPFTDAKMPSVTKTIKTSSEQPVKAKVFRRRRCELERCNQLYRPKKKNQRFCCVEHKHEYHFKSPTFRKFEDEFKGLIRKLVKPGCLR
jgi:hypothetical protein